MLLTKGQARIAGSVVSKLQRKNATVAAIVLLWNVLWIPAWSMACNADPPVADVAPALLEGKGLPLLLRVPVKDKW